MFRAKSWNNSNLSNPFIKSFSLRFTWLFQVFTFKYIKMENLLLFSYKLYTILFIVVFYPEIIFLSSLLFWKSVQKCKFAAKKKNTISNIEYVNYNLCVCKTANFMLIHFLWKNGYVNMSENSQNDSSAAF